jgi:hypothetical protein
VESILCVNFYERQIKLISYAKEEFKLINKCDNCSQYIDYEENTGLLLIFLKNSSFAIFDPLTLNPKC